MKSRDDDYADYGKKGSELRHLVDQLEDTQRTFIKAQDAIGNAMNELDRITRCVNGLAEEVRRNRKRGLKCPS